MNVPLPVSVAAFIAVVCAGMSASSCSDVGAAWNMGWTQRAAHGRIMLVADHPKTLGLKRLESQSRFYPNLGLFLQSKGWPDFLAETNNDGQRYLVFYYLDGKDAYAARTRQSNSRTMEFTGPYRITEGESKLLGKLRKQHREIASGEQ